MPKIGCNLAQSEKEHKTLYVACEPKRERCNVVIIYHGLSTAARAFPLTRTEAKVKEDVQPPLPTGAIYRRPTGRGLNLLPRDKL